MAVALLGFALAVVPVAGRAADARDAADDPVYDDGWQDGDAGGSGWDGGWSFTVDPMPGSAAFGVASSTANGDGDTNGDGDIDTAGRAWFASAQAFGTGYADRRFASALAVGETIRFEVDTQDGATSFEFFSILSDQFERFSIGRSSLPQDVWILRDARGLQAMTGTSAFVPRVDASDEGLRVAFTLTSPVAYDLSITDLGTGEIDTLTGVLDASGSALTGVRLLTSAGDMASPGILLNAIEAPEASGRASAGVALAALRVLIGRAGRRSRDATSGSCAAADVVARYGPHRSTLASDAALADSRLAPARGGR
jgi:hypothetical protein